MLRMDEDFVADPSAYAHDWYPDYEDDLPTDMDNGYYDNAEYDMDSMYDEYGDPYGEEEYTRISMTELMDNCVIPTASQATNTIMPLLGLCLVLRITAYIGTSGPGRGFIPPVLLHLLSATTGLVALYTFFEENLIYGATLALLSYVLLCVTNWKLKGWNGLAVSVVTVIYLTTCELAVVDLKEWHQIRGAQMVLSMKVISLAFDMDHGAVTDMPRLWEFCGYVFHVGSVIFGPWVNYQEYSNLLHQRERKMDFYWVWKILKSSFLALACVVISTCFVHWLILDGSWIWLVAYRDAQSFRFSHYFVCFLSELTMTLSGFGATKANGDVRWDLTVSKPHHVEVPRSLVEVVTNWHLPMHHWLKIYVFKTAKPMGTFSAILLTYAASSLLHGLNFQLAAVLLSLGVYSYIEHVLRNRISSLFSACVQAKRCKSDCQHQYTSMQLFVISTNLAFGFIAVFHLAYLGLMFDSSSEQDQGYTMSHTLGKWKELNYASHWVALSTYIFYLLA